MKKLLQKSVLFLSLILGSNHVQATDYYVGMNGKDSNDGLTYQTAFRTLQFAADKSQAGDKIFVLAGTYAGFYIEKSGTAAAPINFFAYQGVFIESANAQSEDGIYLDGASYIIIEGFTIYNVPGNGIRCIDNHHVVIRKNTCDYTAKSAIFADNSSYLTIEENIASRSKTEHGIYCVNEMDHLILNKNTSRGNGINGIFINSEQGSISNILVKDNTIYEQGGRGAGLILSAVQHSTIQGNLLYNNRGKGIVLDKINSMEAAKNNLILNNTVVQADDANWALLINNGSTGNRVFNNILYLNHTSMGSISIDSSSLSGFQSNNNAMTNLFFIDGIASMLSMNEWRTFTGQDKNSFISSPAALFENAAAKKYTLSAHSPAIDKGMLLPPYTDGFIGVAPDIGAYEYNPALGIAIIKKKPEITFASINANDKLTIYDITGRQVCSGTKADVLNVLQQQPIQVFIFEVVLAESAVSAFGKIQIIK